MITSDKWKQLQNRMHRLNIAEDELLEKFILGSGHGGQKLQKTSSCVFLKHAPTALQVKCQKSRLRDSNRYFARERLCEKIEAILLKEKSEKKSEVFKVKKQKQKRSKRAKQKMLDNKHSRSETKALRKRPY
ncbi:MAG: peptide chain release factor-like protein [Coxiellaceae bacterium]|nr:peptide chain release factor-like protein [Coxiellaceae bacterium]